MNKKTTRLSFIILVSIIVILSLVLAGKKFSTSWLMVLHAGEAKITETGGKTFLTLNEISRNTVMFSDRPERKYQSVDTNQFLEQWDTLFADSPPNAAMVHAEVGVDTELVVIELFKPVISSGEISFPIKIVGGEYTKGKKYADVNLFIDSAWDVFVRIVTSSGPAAVSPTKKTTTTNNEDSSEGVMVTVSGGHEIPDTDKGQPLELIGGLLGITGAQARDSFYYPFPKDGNLNDWNALFLEQLEYYGLRVDELDIALIRYLPTTEGVWNYTHADLRAIIENNVVVGFEIIDGGRGYTSQPTITVEGYDDVGVEMTISYTKDFETNGAITDIRLREEVAEVVPIKKAPIEIDYDAPKWR